MLRAGPNPIVSKYKKTGFIIENSNFSEQNQDIHGLIWTLGVDSAFVWHFTKELYSEADFKDENFRNDYGSE